MTSLAAALLAAGALGPSLAGCGSSNNGPAITSLNGDGGGGGGGGDSGNFGPYDAPIRGPYDAASLDDAASSTCQALTAYAQCQMADPCAPLDAKDCYAFDGIFSLTGRKAMIACYGAASACAIDAGTSVEQCMLTAALGTTPDTAQKKLATDFCTTCSPGDSTCAGSFYSAGAGDAGALGIGANLGLTLVADSTIQMLDSKCLAGLKGTPDECGFSFTNCAGAVIDPTLCSGQMVPMSDGGTDGDPGGA